MASFSQSPFVSSLKPVKTSYVLSPNPKNLFTFKNFKVSSSFGPSNPESSPNSQENPSEFPLPDTDPVKLAFGKAKAYKKSIISNSPAPNTVQDPVQESFSEVDRKNDRLKSDEIQDDTAKDYENNEGVVGIDSTSSRIVQNPVTEEKKNDDSDEIKDNDREKEVPLTVKLALEKAKDYKKNNGVADTGAVRVGGSETLDSGLKGRNVKSVGDKQSKKNASKKEELTISSIDFVGLEFSDKRKSRGLPAGLVPMTDTFPEGELPEVEIIIGDSTKFGDAAAASKPMPTKEEDADLYKPKVSTWGLFPRPNNISKSFGGGRNILPGEALETAEDRAAKEARTRQLLAAYKSKIGLRIDPKLKIECEEALKDGDSLMDLGKLKEALPFYEEVMEKLAFQTELHGLAALQWSICQDSLSRCSYNTSPFSESALLWHLDVNNTFRT
ncbi:uncharacterized protein LOC105169554 [Olea europaea subsp. europaea]|uniref:Uncharacterized protein LOC105169554 n=1 Tax=Olea europaea subsp. europaea TaxID=158383 RepID=A0A8S0PI70_OLEEU|nr:uncharacterized protein LOC105169554 [Olea europaea subsp. europaea]